MIVCGFKVSKLNNFTLRLALRSIPVTLACVIIVVRSAVDEWYFNIPPSSAITPDDADEPQPYLQRNFQKGDLRVRHKCY